VDKTFIEIILWAYNTPLYYSIPLVILLWAIIGFSLFYFMKKTKPYIDYFLMELKKKIEKIKEIEKKRK